MAVTDDGGFKGQHWLARWAPALAAAVAIGSTGLTLVIHFSTDDSRLAALEQRVTESKTRQDKADESIGSIQKDVGEIRQQTIDTNETVHQILGSMIRKQARADSN